jgi:hypothetical protein
VAFSACKQLERAVICHHVCAKFCIFIVLMRRTAQRSAPPLNGVVMCQSERPVTAIRTTLAVLGLLSLFDAVAGSGAYGEGYSAPAPGVDAEIYWRSFSVGDMAEICGVSPVPSEFRARPLTLRIGERLHRTAKSGVIIEAYDSRSGFLPHVPIRINLIDPDDVVRSGFWEDGDYLRAEREGVAELRVSWACGASDRPPVQFPIPIMVLRK